MPLDWITTHSGGRFYPGRPRPEDFRIKDIAAALSKLCRYGGHTTEFYSVAQHSVLVAAALEYNNEDPLDQLIGLLHDAPEAYLGDVVKPLKHSDSMVAYRFLEEQVWNALAQRLGLHPAIPSIVHQADQAIIFHEKQALLRCTDWHPEKDSRYHFNEIIPWPPKNAEETFLRVWERLAEKTGLQLD